MMDEYAQKALFRFLHLTFRQQRDTIDGILSTIADYEHGLVSEPKMEDKSADTENMYRQ